MAAVVDGLPPRIAERVAPVDALRRFDLEDERLIGCELPAADDGPVLGGCADRGAVDRRQEAVGWAARAEVEEELQVVVDEVAEREQLPGDRDVECDRAVLRLDRVAETLDVQRRRHLGVPVVEEVAHGQGRVVTVDLAASSRRARRRTGSTSKSPLESTSSSSTSALVVEAIPFIV